MADQPKSDLQRAYEALTAKQQPYTTLFNYYFGDQPLRYVSDRLKEVFGTSEARFTLNWCAVVVDAELERIRLNEFTFAAPKRADSAAAPTEPVTPPEQTALNDLYVATELNLDSDDVHRDVLVTGEGFVVAWRDDGGEIEAYRNDPRLCHVFYDPQHPRRKAFAVKWWVGDDGKRYLNLYYPDRIEHYVSSGSAESVSAYTAFGLIGEAEPNTFGIIPVFHFRRDRAYGSSALDNATDPQDSINKLFQDMMVSAEFGAFRQRYAVTNADTSALKTAPDTVMRLPLAPEGFEGTQVGEFSATDLKNYLDAMDKIATFTAVITRTPKHYLFAQQGDPSGEALIAMEAPLNKKTQTDIDRLKPTWSELASFLLLLDSQTVPARSITPMFERPETVQPRTEAEIRQLDVNSGLPLETILKREGWTEQEIADMKKDKAQEDAAKAAAAQPAQAGGDATGSGNDLMLENLASHFGLTTNGTAAASTANPA